LQRPTNNTKTAGDVKGLTSEAQPIDHPWQYVALMTDSAHDFCSIVVFRTSPDEVIHVEHPNMSEIADFEPMSAARSASAVTPSEKSLVNTLCEL